MKSEDHPNKVQRLSSPVSSSVRAASILPSLNRVVEELVLNSLDACSCNIEVKVNLRTLSVEVKDDGVGICYNDLKDKAGEWNSTSKSENGSSHGFRGEALAGTRILSSMTVTSKVADCRSTYVKSFGQGDSTEQDICTLKSSKSSIIHSGTIVRVSQLFSRLPARRKAIRPNLEMLRVKEFIQKMSILYHDVEWVLIDNSTDKIILNLEVQPSVSARFFVFHGQDIQCRMKNISATYGPFQLSGLLSPPLPECCHWTKEYQYLFVNNRWMRGTEIVANMMDRVYVTALTSQRSGGPASKHHAPKGTQVSSHPCFVLQLTCPSESYDVLCEPDKTKAVFTDPYAVKLCVKQLLLEMFQCYNPELLTAADTLCGGYHNGNYVKSVRTEEGVQYTDSLKADSIVPEMTKLYAVQTRSESDRASSYRETQHLSLSRPVGNSTRISLESGQPSTPNFRTAFLETPPDKIPLGAAIVRPMPLSLFSEFEFNSTSSGRSSGETDECAVQSPSSDDRSSFPLVGGIGGGTVGVYTLFGSSSDSNDSENYCMAPVYSDITSNGPSIGASIGVTVTRLPGLLEYIDDQLVSSSQSSTESSYEDIPINNRVNNNNNKNSNRHNDTCSDDSAWDWGTGIGGEFLDEPLSPYFRPHTQPRDTSHVPTSGDSSPIRSEDNCTSYTIRNQNYNQTYSQNQNQNQNQYRFDTVQPVHGNATISTGTYHHRNRTHSDRDTDDIIDFNGPEFPSNLIEDSSHRYIPLPCPEEDPITPAPRRVEDKPIDLFSLEFTDAFFSSTPDTKKNAISVYKSQFLRDEASLATQKWTMKNSSTIIGAKRIREGKDARMLSTDTSLDSDFTSNDVRTTLNMKSRNRNRYTTATSRTLIKPPDTVTTSMTLRKDMLKGVKTVGQVDSKYLLVTSGKLILIVDQHAADERVKLEEFLRSFGSNDGEECSSESEERTVSASASSVGTLKVCYTVHLTAGDLYTLTTRPEVFHVWGFLFDQMTVSATDPPSGNSSTMTAVQLTQVPVFFEEPLNPQDFLEFIHLVSEHSKWMAPKSLLKPPSLNRIASSRACRTAVRFGDVLNLSECTDIMRKLSKTDLPFQCAHGRPSVVPLLQLEKEKFMCETAITNSFINPSIKSIPVGRKPKYLKTPNYSNILHLLNS